MRSLLACYTLGLGIFPGVLGDDILSTSGFTNCLEQASSQIAVQNLDIKFDRQTSQITFNVSGSSTKEQNVTASLSVLAYGKLAYSKDFDPCDTATRVSQLCPIPKGSFAAQGAQTIPAEYANQIPSIAFSIPDLEGAAKLELKAQGSGADLACIQSDVNNGKTMEIPAISYIALGIGVSSLVLTGISALSSAGATGAPSASPGFGTCLGVFQSFATNGMLSVQYPPVYRSFTKNFAFSGGLISWNSMQTTIDNFRAKTGGNLSEDSVQYLRNSTLLYSDTSNGSSMPSRRSLDHTLYPFESLLENRDVSTAINGTQTGNVTATSNGTSSAENKVTHVVYGIQGYVEQLTIPQANTFMTVLLIFSLVIAAIALGILLLKVILESWALFASFPQKLSGFRKRYWGILARTVVNLILLLYGVWTLYCIFQFTNGDSWAAKILAGTTLAVFTAILGFFAIRIWLLARRYKQLEGDTSVLFDDKETWRKYSLFYDGYKRGYWWLFIPFIVYMFARGCVIAAANGHGLTQSVGQLIVESIMMVVVLFARPYVTTQGNVINVFIHCVRVLSVVCILVFVEELGIAQSTKTITGVILIVVQSVLTVVLGILIAVNAIIVCVRENPHKKQRKEAQALNRDLDNLTPLDARNSLLLYPAGCDKDFKNSNVRSYPLENLDRDKARYDWRWDGREGSEGKGLAGDAAPMGERGRRRTSSQESFNRQPTVPDLGFHHGQAV